MPNYELYPRLSLLTLATETIDKREGDEWGDQLVFIGTPEKQEHCRMLENHLSLTYDGKYCG